MFTKLMGINLRTKLIIISLMITIIPLLLLGFFTYKYVSDILQEDLSQNELKHLTTLDNQVTYFFKDIEQMSLFFLKNEQINEILNKDPNRSSIEKYKDFQAVKALFNTVTSVKNWDVNIYIVGENGDRYFSNTYLPQNYNHIRDYWSIFRKAKLASGALAWDTNYSISKLDAQDVVLTAGRLIRDPQTDEQLGYIMIDINEAALSSLYDENSFLENEHFYIIDYQGHILSSQSDKNIIGTKLESDYIGRILDGDKGYFKYNNGGQDTIVTYHTSSHTGLKLISEKPLDAVRQKNSLIRKLTWSFALLGIIISAWLAYFLSKSITNPLYKLIYLMGKVEKGHLDVRFNSKYEDDIGILGKRFNKMLQKLKNLIQDSYEKQLRIRDSELKALRSQINPHFLYNTLDTVNWLARLKNANDISRIVVSLSEILKYSINEDDELVTIEKDLKQLTNYLTIQEFRYRDKFDVHMSIDNEAMNGLLPPLLIQPLVENAIVHGLENKINKGNIYITIKRLERQIELTIEDDGVGMNEQIVKKINKEPEDKAFSTDLGVGMENVRKRLFLHYGHDHEWVLKSAPSEGTFIKITVPYKKRYKDV